MTLWLFETYNEKTLKKKLFLVKAKDNDSALHLVLKHEFGEEAYFLCGFLKRVSIVIDGVYGYSKHEPEKIIYANEITGFKRLGINIQDIEF